MALAEKSGSQYEDYDTTSNTYDNGRRPIGLQVILGALAYSGGKLQKPLDQLQVLDAGCGTGNYCEALSPFVGTIQGLEFSEGMLEKARKKTEDLKNVKLQQGDITDMPFPHEHFAGVTINQVIHHLVLPGQDFSRLEKVFKEAHRVLVPNGVLVVNTCSREQNEKSVWFNSVVPQVREKLTLRYPPIEFITSTLAELGFSIGGVYGLLTETLIRPEVFFDKEGPLQKSWRNMDSMWALATQVELEAGLEQWKQKVESGEADKVIAEHEEQRKKLGITTSIVAYKL